MDYDPGFDWKAVAALTLGNEYLSVENAHLTEIHADSDYWHAIASTDSSDGECPPGPVLDLGTTYCRRVLAAGTGWYVADDGPGIPAGERSPSSGEAIRSRQKGVDWDWRSSVML